MSVSQLKLGGRILPDIICSTYIPVADLGQFRGSSQTGWEGGVWVPQWLHAQRKIWHYFPVEHSSGHISSTQQC